MALCSFSRATGVPRLAAFFGFLLLFAPPALLLRLLVGRLLPGALLRLGAASRTRRRVLLALRLLRVLALLAALLLATIVRSLLRHDFSFTS